MHLHYLTGIACLFLCGAVGANVAGCQPRNLTVTVDDVMRFYIDGVELTLEPNENNWWKARTVELPCTVRVIGVEGTNTQGGAGVRASTADGYVLTNSSWKCTNKSFTDWQKTGFDDSDWPQAYVAAQTDPVTGIRNDSIWIWTKASWYENGDRLVYCRKTLGVNECRLGPPENECDPLMGKCINLFGNYNCSCYKGYENSGSKRCRDIDECAFGDPVNKCRAATGNCVNLPGSYNCSCHQGYQNIDDQTCKDDAQTYKVSTDNGSTTIIILGVLLGVSVLAIIALIVALCILQSRNKKMNEEGQSGVNTRTHANDIATNGYRSSSAAEEAYEDLNLETLSSNQTDTYVKLQT